MCIELRGPPANSFVTQPDMPVANQRVLTWCLLPRTICLDHFAPVVEQGNSYRCRTPQRPPFSPVQPGPSGTPRPTLERLLGRFLTVLAVVGRYPIKLPQLEQF